jgi:hypothetical protein
MLFHYATHTAGLWHGTCSKWTVVACPGRGQIIKDATIRCRHPRQIGATDRVGSGASRSEVSIMNLKQIVALVLLVLLAAAILLPDL